MRNEDNNWNTYWNRDETLYGKICTFCRNTFISSTLASELDRYFPKSGLFVDCGSGSSESCMKIKKYGKRKLIALDISYPALIEGQKIKNVDAFVNGDIFKLPFADNSINGIFNLGVMEHFTPEQLVEIFDEMHRVLKPGSYAVFFWARLYGSSGIALRAYSVFMNKVLKKKFWYTPDEILPFKSKNEVKKIIGKSKLRYIKASPSFKTLLIHEVVVCQKV